MRMKKLFASLAMVMAVTFGASAEVLVSYQGTATCPAGVEISGTTVMASVKINENTNAKNCIQLANGYSSKNKFNGNAIILSVEGGFKTGDVLSVTGFFNNSDNTKESKVSVITVDAEEKCTVLWTSEQFINGRTNAADPEPQTWTLTEDMDKIILGRTGGTGTNFLYISVTRPEASLSTSGYATFSFCKATSIVTAGVKAYKAAVSGETITLTELSGNIPAGTGVILYGEAGAKVELKEATTGEDADVTGNDLKATTTANGALVAKEDNSWALGTENKFLSYTGAAYVENHAYLVHSTPSARMSIVFSDEATGISNVVSKASARDGKFLENGKFVVVKNGVKYNVAGQAIK